MKARALKSKEGNTLIEWKDEDENVMRSWVPAKDVKGDEVEHPERGVDFGEPLGKAVSHWPNAAKLTQALNNNGIWTFDDARARPNDVLSVVARLYGDIVSDVLTGSAEEEKKHGNA